MRCAMIQTGVAGLFLLGAAAEARGDLLIYEPFDYTAGLEMDGLPATGLNLTGNYASSTIQDLEIASPGLGYGSIAGPVPGVAGNRVTDMNGAGSGIATVSVDQDITSAVGEGFFFSALFTFDDDGNLNRFARITLEDEATGDRITFGEATVGVRAIRIEAETTATGGLISDGADGSFTDGHTYWLIGRYFNSPTAEGDILQLVGYDVSEPDAISTEFDINDPAAEFGFSLDAFDIDLAQVTSLVFSARGDANNHLDEFRLGRSYADVTAIPEPGSFAAGMLAAGWWLRRRRGS